MSEHQSDQTSDIKAESVTPAGEPAAVSAHVEAPTLVPEQGEENKVETPHAATRVMIMSPAHSDGSWHEKSWEEAINRPEPEVDEAPSLHGKRRLSALAAVIALAAVTGAVTGALATASLGRYMAGDDRQAANRALTESVMRMDADIAALKINLERAGKQNVSQFSKTADRLDRVEKAQVEPAAKLAKLSDTVEKLRTTPSAPAPAPVPVAAAPAKEITGSIPTPAPKPDVARLPTLEGWTLVDIANGGATIEGRQGLFEVYAGDPVPGLGRVDAIRKQDGRWVVVTSKGLIVSR